MNGALSWWRPRTYWTVISRFKLSREDKVCTLRENAKLDLKGQDSRIEKRGAAPQYLAGHGNIDHFLHQCVGGDSNLLWFHGKPGSCVFIWLRGRHFSVNTGFSSHQDRKALRLGRNIPEEPRGTEPLLDGAWKHRLLCVTTIPRSW